MTGTLAGMLAAAVLFVAGHLVLSSRPLRPVLIAHLGEGGFRALYATIALVTLVWLIAAYASAPRIVLWPDSAAARILPLVVMPFAAILVVCGLTTRSVTAIGGEAFAGGPAPAPGILKVTRHPFLWGVALWALVHIPPNGDVASLALFASFAGLAFAGMGHIDRRRAAALGAAWGPIALTTSVLPFAALLSRRARLDVAEIGVWRLAGGLVLYAALLFGHGWLVGVPALPN
ncbi:MAG: NnrU family protein [Alphaproteobacteria bacterium]